MFFDFGGGSGFHSHHFHGGHEEEEEKVEEKDYYGILGVQKNAEPNEIKKAYKKCLRKWHPDQFSDPVEKQVATEKFKEIQEAVEILKDPKKKAIYDKYGNAGLQKRKTHREEQKGENLGFEMQVTLSELYNGSKKEVHFKKTVLCEGCEGEGIKDKNISKKKMCTTCDGKGYQVMMRQVGPFVTQQQIKCRNCEGTGEMVSAEDRCVTCKGKKISQKNHTIEVFIEKGMRDGQKLTFHAESHQQPNTTPGDVIVVLREGEDSNEIDFPKFFREGNDLIYKKTISLRQALTGFKFQLKHLDGRILVINSSEGSIIKPGDKKIIENEGMPAYKNPLNKGRLVIDFDVEFPTSGTFNESTIKQLSDLLNHQSDLEENLEDIVPPLLNESSGGSSNSSSSNTNVHHYTFADYEELEEDEKASNKKQAYDEDEGDEEGERGGAVGCRFM